MKRWLIVAVVLLLAPLAQAQSAPDFVPTPLPSGINLLRIDEMGVASWVHTPFSFEWDGKKKYLEIKGENITLRVYESGKVERFTWDVLYKGTERDYECYKLTY